MKKIFTDHTNANLNRLFKDFRHYKPLSRSEELELVIAAQSGDMCARDTLIQHNAAYVISLAKEMETPFVEALDLFEEGIFGLRDAIDNMDTKRGNRFITVAKPFIMKYITETLSKNRLVHFPDNEVRMMNKGEKENCEVVYYQDEESHYNLENDPSYSCEMSNDQMDIMDEVYAFLGTIAPKKANIFRQSYGLDDGFEHAPEMVAFLNNCSRERVRQVNNEVIVSLRQHFGVHSAA